MIQQPQSWAHIRRNSTLKRFVHTNAHCSTVSIVRQGSNISVHLQIKGQRRCAYIYENYPAMKKNEIMTFVARRTDLEIIILNEVSQKKTDTWYHLYVGSKKKNK